MGRPVRPVRLLILWVGHPLGGTGTPQVFAADWNCSDLVSTPAGTQTPVTFGFGSGQLGYPCDRMHAAALTALRNS